MNRLRLLLVAVVLLMPGLSPCAAGQETTTTTQTTLDLKAAIEQLERDIDAERQAIAQLKERGQRDVRESKARADRLAAELAAATKTRDELTPREKKLREEWAEVSQRRRELEGAAAETLRALRAAAETAAIRLREIPGGHDDAETLHAAAKHEDPALLAGVVLHALNELHTQATTVGVTRAELWTASKQRESVRLLHVGHVGFAYQASDGRLGLALASPADASGFRWSEDLDAPVAQALKQLFDALENAPDGSLVSIPLDVTGKLRFDPAAADDSFAAMIQSGGLVMWPLGFVGVMALLLIGERVWYLFIRNRDDSARVARVMASCRAGDTARALGECEAGMGVASRTLAALLRRRDAGQHAMEDSIQEQLLVELPRLGRFLGGIAMLAAVAPLLGLLGTVTGIIATFDVIKGFGNANPALLAGGISEALVTTAAGLILAIPILLIHSVLKGRVERVIGDAEKHAATLLNILAHDKANHARTP